MIHFFGDVKDTIFVVQTSTPLLENDIDKLTWLFAGQPLLEESVITNFFIGPRAAMITPWSTNAVEITQNMGIQNIHNIQVNGCNSSVFASNEFSCLRKIYSEAMSEGVISVHLCYH